jgi:hypothetical protein
MPGGTKSSEFRASTRRERLRTRLVLAGYLRCSTSPPEQTSMSVSVTLAKSTDVAFDFGEWCGHGLDVHSSSDRCGPSRNSQAVRGRRRRPESTGHAPLGLRPESWPICSASGQDIGRPPCASVTFTPRAAEQERPGREKGMRLGEASSEMFREHHLQRRRTAGRVQPVGPPRYAVPADRRAGGNDSMVVQRVLPTKS